MLKIAIIDTSDTIPKTTVNVHLTNCFIVKTHLQRQGHKVTMLVSSSEMPKASDFDIVLVSYGSRYFDFKKWLNFIQRQYNARTGWMTNDYDLSPNSALLSSFDFVITNHDKSHQSVWKDTKQLLCNLNSLVTFDDRRRVKKKHNAIYYGTFRKGREHYFQKYLQNKVVLISTSTKNMKKFKHIGCDAMYIDKIKWQKGKQTLRLFKYSLYVEDETTHKWFSHLANRFYESISCGCLPIIDENCKNSFDKSIFDISDFPIISSHKDIKSLNMSDEKIEQIVNKNLKKALQEKRETLDAIGKFILRMAR